MKSIMNNIMPKATTYKKKVVNFGKPSTSDNAIKQKTVMTKGINRTKTKINMK